MLWASSIMGRFTVHRFIRGIKFFWVAVFLVFPSAGKAQPNYTVTISGRLADDGSANPVWVGDWGNYTRNPSYYGTYYTGATDYRKDLDHWRVFTGAIINVQNNMSYTSLVLYVECRVSVDGGEYSLVSHGWEFCGTNSYTTINVGVVLLIDSGSTVRTQWRAMVESYGDSYYANNGPVYLVQGFAPTPTPTFTKTPTPTNTPIPPTPTTKPVGTPTNTPVPPTPTFTPVPPTPTPTRTNTPTPTATSVTPTPTFTPTFTPTKTPVPTSTSTPTRTPTPLPTSTISNDLAVEQVGVTEEVIQGYNQIGYFGLLKNVGQSLINSSTITVDYYLYPDGSWPSAQKIHTDSHFGPFWPGAYESHFYEYWKTWTPGNWRIRAVHNWSDDNAANNQLDSAIIKVVTWTPTPSYTPTPTNTPTLSADTPTPTYTPTPTWTITPTFTPVTPSPTNTRGVSPTPTSPSGQNDIAAWDAYWRIHEDNPNYRVFTGLFKNVGTTTFDIGSGQPDGLRIRLYRKRLDFPTASLVGDGRMLGPEYSPKEWPIGWVGEKEYVVNVSSWDYGEYDMWFEHNASDPIEETGYSEQDQNPDNDVCHFSYIVPTPTPTFTKTPTPTNTPTPTLFVDMKPIQVVVPATPVYGGNNVGIPFTLVWGNVGIGTATDSQLRSVWDLDQIGTYNDAWGFLIDSGPIPPYPTPGWDKTHNIVIYHNWQPGNYQIRYRSWYHTDTGMDRDPTNDSLYSPTFVVLPTPTNTPTPTHTPTKPSLGVVIEVDDTIWHLVRDGKYP